MPKKRIDVKPDTEPTKEALRKTREQLEREGLPTDDVSPAPADTEQSVDEPNDLTVSGVQPGVSLFKGQRAPRPTIEADNDRENQRDARDDVLLR